MKASEKYMEAKYEYIFNMIESLKSSYKEGEEIITILDFCQDLISDERLLYFPDEVEICAHNCVLFNFEDSILENHLVVRIKTYGFNYDDKVLSYFYIKGTETVSNENASWNEVVNIINKWHKYLI